MSFCLFALVFTVLHCREKPSPFYKASARTVFTSFSIGLAWADFLLDVAFARRAFEVNSMVAWPYSSLVLVLYALVSFFCVLGVVVALRCPIGWFDLSEHRNELWSNGQVAFVLSLALTNIELLKVLPWKAESAQFDGFPTRKLLGVVIAISLLEDIPQLVLQVLFLREADHL